MKNSTAYALILAAAGIWGTIGFFVRSITAAGLSETQLIAVRCILSAAVMVIFLAIYDRRLLRIRLRDVWMFLGTGILSFDAFTICYFTAVGMTSLSVAAILLYTSPIFVTVLAVPFFHEKFTKKKLICLLMAFSGCVLVSGFPAAASGGSGLGILLGILSGFFYGLYSIFGQFALRRYHTLTIITYTFIFASLGILPFADLAGLQGAAWSPGLAWEVIFFAIMSGAAAYLLYTLGMSKVKATNAAIAAIFEPVVAALTGVFVYDESLSAAGITGIVLVIAAILFLSMPVGRSAENTPKKSRVK